MDFLLAQCSVL